MIVRDLLTLENILEKKIKLGLDLGDQSVLNEFTKKTKSKNFIFASGVDLLNKVFSINNASFKRIRNYSLEKMNKNFFVKDIFLKIADEGLNF